MTIDGNGIMPSVHLDKRLLAKQLGQLWPDILERSFNVRFQ